MDASNRRVVINVGGIKFETYASTLLTFPGTKLASLAESASCSANDYDQKNNEFFFDRNPKVFEYVLDFYRTKHLHCSDDMCRSVMMEELNFWDISSTHLARCCWLKMNNNVIDLEDFGTWDEILQTDPQQLLVESSRVDYTWRGRWQPKVWTLFEMPLSSLASMCIRAVSILFTIGAIVIFFEETKQQFVYLMNYTQSSSEDNYMSVKQALDHQKVAYLLFLELVCVLWFIFEFCVRFIFCPDKRKFIRNFLNVVDFFSLFPVFVELIARGNVSKMDMLWKTMGFFRLVYILKLLRIILLIEGSLILKVLSGTLRSIMKEIFILLLVLAFETLFFACLAFYAEWANAYMYLYNHDVFDDIYSCCWWAIVTLTTVGYGDIYPMTTFGKIVSSLAAISGIMTIVIPIPILMIKFQHYYNIALAGEKLKLHRSNEQKL
ncbi:potassium voltage-gated channel subfamily C member 3 [Bombina bombina]|uniref:potassium voltage-gated channel subfamily C member 3 n=1 Tax=Bombina bombina TaxID=8345 RepID=UPI00235AAF77|nr:potassium voltage-gated channel subfamily C member 3 [Bombina bombina]